MTEQWRPIPGFEGSYEVSDRGRVRSLPRVIIRSNYVAYSCQARILRAKQHPVSGLWTVTLSRGRRGDQHYAYVHRLVQSVFGEAVNAA
jgi:hypothetical protein